MFKDLLGELDVLCRPTLAVGLATLAALLASCGGGGGTSSPPSAGVVSTPSGPVLTSSFFPLMEKSLWIFDTQTAKREYLQITGTRTMSGENYTVFLGSNTFDSTTTEILIRKTGASVEQRLTDPATIKAVGKSQLDLFRFPAAIGDSFVQFENTSDIGIDYDQDGIPETINSRAIVTVVASENVATHSGDFSTAVKVKTSTSLTIISSRTRIALSTSERYQYDWYVDQLGTVKTEVYFKPLNGPEVLSSASSLGRYAVGELKSDYTKPKLRATMLNEVGQRVTGGAILVSFDKDFVTTTPGSGNIEAIDPKGNKIEGTVEIVSSKSIRFRPTAVWQHGNEVSLKIGAGIADDLRNEVVPIQVRYLINLDPLAIVRHNPAKDEIDVPSDTPINVEFNKEIAEFGSPAFITPIPLKTVSLSSELVEGRRLVITPRNSLPGASQYLIDLSAIHSTDGESFSNTAQKTGQFSRWYFYTAQNPLSFPVRFQAGEAHHLGYRLADMNNDGILDVVSTSSLYGLGPDDPSMGHNVLINYLDRQGRSTSTTVIDLSTSDPRWSPGSTRDIDIGDLNGDGIKDIAVHYEGNFFVLLGASDGRYSQAAHIDLRSFTVPAIIVKDIDGDGRAEILFSPNNSEIHVLRLDALGLLSKSIIQEYGLFFFDNFSIADVNLDGRQDIVIVGTNQPIALGVMYQTGTGTFASPVSLDTAGRKLASIQIRDMNQDGRPDIVGMFNDSNSPQGLGILYQRSDHSFQPLITIAKTSKGNVSALAIGDLNADGRPDLLLWYSTAEYGYSTFLQSNTGSFTNSTDFRVSEDAASGYPQIGDLEGDGFSEIFLGGRHLILNRKNWGGAQAQASELMNKFQFSRTR